MALTDIAKKLKDTFDGFSVSAHQDELKHYRELYGDAECVQIGEMDYIVINDVYKSKEYSDVPESTSPLFFNSINNSYAIIDDKIAVGDNRRELIEQYTNLEHLNREIVETLIDYISIGKRIPGTRNVPIEIHWNF